MDLEGNGKTKAWVGEECNALQRDLGGDRADRLAVVQSIDCLPKVAVSTMVIHVEMQWPGERAEGGVVPPTDFAPNRIHRID